MQLDGTPSKEGRGLEVESKDLKGALRSWKTADQKRPAPQSPPTVLKAHLSQERAGSGDLRRGSE